MVWKIEDKNISAEHFIGWEEYWWRHFVQDITFWLCFYRLFDRNLDCQLYMGRTAEPDRNFYRSLSYEIKEWKDIFSTVHLVFDSGTGNFFPDAVFGDGNPDQKNCGSVFSSVDWDVRRNFTVRGSGRIRNEGKYSLCGRTISTVPFMFRQFLCFCAFVGTIHRISGTDKNVLCMRFVFNWDFSESCLNPWLIQKIVNILLISWESVSNATRQTVDWLMKSPHRYPVIP